MAAFIIFNQLYTVQHQHIARLKEESKCYDVYWSFVRIVIAIGIRQVFKSWRSKNGNI